MYQHGHCGIQGTGKTAQSTRKYINTQTKIPQERRGSTYSCGGQQVSEEGLWAVGPSTPWVPTPYPTTEVLHQVIGGVEVVIANLHMVII